MPEGTDAHRGNELNKIIQIDVDFTKSVPRLFGPLLKSKSDLLVGLQQRVDSVCSRICPGDPCRWCPEPFLVFGTLSPHKSSL